MKKLVLFIVLGVLIVIGFVKAPIWTIDSTERGIVYRLGEVQDYTIQPWFYVLMPFVNSITRVKIVPQTIEVDIPVSSAGAITKDNQTIWSEITVFYRFKDSELVNVARNYGFELLKAKVTRDVTEAFKQTIGAYTIFDVAQKQEEIRQIFLSGARTKIGAYPLTIDDIKVSNYDWSDEFDAQIALTMKIAQESKQQEQELKKIQISAQQQVVQAQANFDAEKLNADAAKVKGEGIAAYNQAITSNPRNMELELKLKTIELEKARIDKRDGKFVPINNYGPIPLSTNNANQWQ